MKEKIKIGVLTFHRSLNYGAVLQAKGLVTKLNSLGYEAEIIDYRNKKLEERDSLKRLYKEKGIFRKIYNFFELPMWIIRRKKFDRFVGNISSNKKLTVLDSNKAQLYDHILVGSDQVWNYKVTDSDDTYVLKGINCRKSSYAASFGISEIPHNKVDYYYPLREFENITVRESQGKDLIKSILEKNSLVVVDPTFLLTSEEWKEEFNNLPSPGERYILVYQRAFSKELIDFAKKLAWKMKCKIYTINGNPRQIYKAKYINNAGPEEFLMYLHNAEYIVTNSFHGIALSINLNKQFYFEKLDKKFGVNSRLENIVENYKLSNRNINKVDLDNMEIINFFDINNKLLEERKEAEMFLKKLAQDLKDCD